MKLIGLEIIFIISEQAGDLFSEQNLIISYIVVYIFYANHNFFFLFFLQPPEAISRPADAPVRELLQR